MSYSEHFETEAAADDYDQAQYAPSSYSSLLWSIEKQQLDSLIQHEVGDEPFDYLDFASGTGRVLAYVSPRTRSARGIEVSPAMAARARRIPRVEVDCRDITHPDSEIEATYDVITAFRFFLNAEPSLRVNAMNSLVTRLRNNESALIFNNHGNMFSHKALLYLWHYFRARGGRQPTGNYLSHRAIRKLAGSCGLTIERVAGCGLLGGRLAQKLPSRLVERIEKRFACSRLAFLGSNQIYVAHAAQGKVR